MGGDLATKELICELCRQFFQLGWVTGTGGSISIRKGDSIYMTPSGVQKERIHPNEIFELDLEGNVVSTPNEKPGFSPKLSDCSVLFMHAYKQRNAGAVLHSHGKFCNVITSMFEGKSEFRLSHQEMIKGIKGHGYRDELVIPIIENTAHEHELADSLGAAIAAYPNAYAVLVRRHGMYVWGDTWEQAKRHGECLHYLFEVCVTMRKQRLDFTLPSVTAVPTCPTNIKIKHAPFHDLPLYKDIKGTMIEQSQRELVCELCRQFYMSGWVTGTGGSISMRHGEAIFMTPSAVQKERIQPDELYIIDRNGMILSEPAVKPNFTPKLSDCSPLFLHAFQQRNAGAVLHSHAICCNIITSIFEGKREFRLSHQEMIKGMKGHGYWDELVIPIIENTAHEHELADSLGEAIAAYPKANAVLVRRHGMYVWGDTWEQAKRHGESLHYLFDVCLVMREIDMDFTKPAITATSGNSSSADISTLAIVGSKRPIETSSNDNGESSHIGKRAAIRDSHSNGTTNGHAKKSSSPYKYYVFDIEGTTTPITFVKDELFPYASTTVESFLHTTWHAKETENDVGALYTQFLEHDAYDVSIVNELSTFQESTKYPLKKEDFESSILKGSKETQIEWLTKYVQWNIQLDRKIGTLKQLQGHIWRQGYEAGTIKGALFSDIPSTFQRILDCGAKIAIYNSGSREAQRLLFQYSVYGDLSPFISAYFDTKVGLKQEFNSYHEIALSLGLAHKPAEILFVTDIIPEGRAAIKAGMHAAISVRPGNAKFDPTDIQDFGLHYSVTSFDQLP